jgi:hypothetical protein
MPHLRGESLEACAGTRISDDAGAMADAVGSGKGLVKGFATIDNVALINVEGTGMVRASRVAPRVVHAKFIALRSTLIGCMRIRHALMRKQTFCVSLNLAAASILEASQHQVTCCFSTVRRVSARQSAKRQASLLRHHC